MLKFQACCTEDTTTAYSGIEICCSVVEISSESTPRAILDYILALEYKTHFGSVAISFLIVCNM